MVQPTASPTLSTAAVERPSPEESMTKKKQAMAMEEVEEEAISQISLSTAYKDSL